MHLLRGAPDGGSLPHLPPDSRCALARPEWALRLRRAAWVRPYPRARHRRAADNRLELRGGLRPSLARPSCESLCAVDAATVVRAGVGREVGDAGGTRVAAVAREHEPGP